MSLTTTVFLERSRLPTADAWSRAILSHGFALELSVDLTLEDLDGYLPCTYQGAPAGFECVAQNVKDYFFKEAVPSRDPRRRAVGSRDLALSFITHSELRDLACATIASAALAEIADGLLWSDEAGDLFTHEEAACHARDLEQELCAPPEPVAPPASPRVVTAAQRAQVVFRGVRTLMIKPVDGAGRYTLSVDTAHLPASKEIEIVSLWEHPVGSATVHTVRIGAVTIELDPRGGLVTGPGPDVAGLIKQLGVVESATRGLLAAGSAAAPALGAVAADPSYAMPTRRMAIVILGQLGGHARTERARLTALTAHPDLGSEATRALQLIQI